MTFREKQNEIIETLNTLPDWHARYSHIIDIGQDIPPMPENLKIQANRIETCPSRTYFYVEKQEKTLIYGWSNSAIPSGLVALFMQMCNGFPPAEIHAETIGFHIRTGLLDSLSPTRKAGLLEMIRRITAV